MDKINQDCVFCRIGAGELGAFTHVTEDDILYNQGGLKAFLSRSNYPNIPCKILLIPVSHIQTFDSLHIDQSYNLTTAIQKLSRAIQQATDSIGTFVWFQNGLKVQDIPHFHVRILPRFENDNFLQAITQGTILKSQDRLEWARKIKSFI